MNGEVLSVGKYPNGAAVFPVVGEKRVDYLRERAEVGILRRHLRREVIHFHEADAGAVILARHNRGVCAGRQCRDNR